MSFAPAKVCFAPLGDGSILGAFRSKETDALFEFSAAKEDEKVFGARFAHKVWVDNGESFRFAEVKKTVAFVVVDEAEDGSAVVEKWATKGFRSFVE